MSIIGTHIVELPSQHGKHAMLAVLVNQSQNPNYAHHVCYLGHILLPRGDDQWLEEEALWISALGRKMPFEEARLHFPGIQKELYR